MATVTKKFAWSYSALTSFETCPRKHYETRIAKSFIEAESEEMRWGNLVHKKLEERVRDGKPLPGNMVQYEPLAKKLADAPGIKYVELPITFNADLEATELFAKDAWLRAKVDLAIKRGNTLKMIDYKTGKRKLDGDQLKLFAACGFAAFPSIEVIQTSYYWLPTKQVDNETFTKKDESIIWQEFEPRVSRMEEAFDNGYFPEKPSGLCRGWCPVKSCQHWEAKR